MQDGRRKSSDGGEPPRQRVFGLNPRATPRKARREAPDLEPKQAASKVALPKPAADKKAEPATMSSSDKIEAKAALGSDKRDQNEDHSAKRQPLAEKPAAPQASRLDEVPKHEQPAREEQKVSEPQDARRTNFYVPPPRQISTAKGFGVSYAKSKIYDRKHPHQSQLVQRQQQQRASGIDEQLASSSCLGAPSGELHVPASILSGYKPPRQVNVSQARARWEASEPFARTRSRRTLAAKQQVQRQSCKTAPISIWSAASVVDQRVQLQAALAAACAAPKAAAADQAAKLLARGSVLERVQRFEKAPREEAVPSRDESELQPHQLAAAREEPSMQVAKSKQVQPQPLPELASRVLRRRSSTASPRFGAIPRFYAPPERAKPNTYEVERCRQRVAACFAQLPEMRATLTAPASRRHFQLIACACGLTNYYKEPLYHYVKFQLSEEAAAPSVAPTSQASGAKGRRATLLPQQRFPGAASRLSKAVSLDSPQAPASGGQSLSCDQFLGIWMNVLSSSTDTASRLVHLLTLGRRDFLLPDDLVPLVQAVIDEHPGLKFLRQAPDFHLRYVQTVIARIFFNCNKTWTGKLSLKEIRHCNLLAVIDSLSAEADINAVADYFSYEHFYVIYCKFWALDTDHDLYISKADLAKHQNDAISARILDRIFEGIVSPAASSTIRTRGKMSYPEFVWFFYAEEDKKHPKSVEYWFRLIDMDGDGFLSLYELEYFYTEQVKRLRLMNIEALSFEDSICQILDLIKPRDPNKIALSDLKRSKMTTVFFDTFVNLEKYLEHETGDYGASSRDLIINGRVVSDFERVCNYEYQSLISNEETNV